MKIYSKNRDNVIENEESIEDLKMSSYERVVKRGYKVFNEFKKQGGNIRNVDEKGNSIGFYAVEYRNYEIINELINEKIIIPIDGLYYLKEDVTVKYERDGRQTTVIHESGAYVRAKIICQLLIENDNVEALKKMGFFTSDEKYDISKPGKKVEELIYSSIKRLNDFFNYMIVVGNESKASQILNYIEKKNKQNQDIIDKKLKLNYKSYDKGEKIYLLSENSISRYKVEFDRRKKHPQYPPDSNYLDVFSFYDQESGDCVLEKNTIVNKNVIKMIENFTLDFCKRYFELNLPELTEGLVAAISKNKKEKLFKYYDEKIKKEKSAFFLSVGAEKELGEEGLIALDVNEVIKKGKLELALKIIECRNLKIQKIIDYVLLDCVEDALRTGRVYDFHEEEYYRNVSISNSNQKVKTKEELYELINEIDSRLVRDVLNSSSYYRKPKEVLNYDYFLRWMAWDYLDYGLIIGTNNYEFIKKTMELFPVYIRDAILTKYTKGEIIVIKALVDSGGAFLLPAQPIVTSPLNFIMNGSANESEWNSKSSTYISSMFTFIDISKNLKKYEDTRDMTRTNMTKMILRNEKNL